MIQMEVALKQWKDGDRSSALIKWNQYDAGYLTKRWNETAVQYKCEIPAHFAKFITAVNRLDETGIIQAAHQAADPLINDRAFIRDPYDC